MTNSLYSSNVMRNGKHHFDDKVFEDHSPNKEQKRDASNGEIEPEEGTLNVDTVIRDDDEVRDEDFD